MILPLHPNAKKNPSENDDTEKQSASCFSFVRLSAFSSPTSIQTPAGRHSDAYFFERSAETAITRMQKEGQNTSNKIYNKKNWDRKSYPSTVTEKRQRQLNGQRVFLIFFCWPACAATRLTQSSGLKRYERRDKRAAVCRQKLNTWGRAIDRSASRAQTQTAGTENRITRDLMPLPEI